MKIKLSAIAVLFMSGLVLSSCLSDGDDTIVLQSEKQDEGIEAFIVSTDESRTLTTNGYSLTVPRNAVPANSSGENGKVAFSITPETELPGALPSGVTLVSNTCMRMEPMNFVFRSPLVVKIPTKGNDPSGLMLLRYNEATQSWDNIPFSLVDGNTVEASVIELGIFAVVKANQTRTYGGITIPRSQLDRDYVYYITVTRDGDSSSRSIAYSNNSKDLYMGNLPLGSYSAVITRQLRSGLGGEESITEWCQISGIRVSQQLIASGEGYDSYTGWTVVNLNNTGWIKGRPDSAWGSATVTYGTGTFQATLTWVNSDANGKTDVDLHLDGPDGLHVYFGNRNQGGFELDRDWLKEYGNAVENIYSVSDSFTSGEYTVSVRLYGGYAPKRYNCRIIMNGVVVKSTTGTLTSSSTSHEIYKFSI